MGRGEGEGQRQQKETEREIVLLSPCLNWSEKYDSTGILLLITTFGRRE
jgi:hypothetical protein